MANHKHEHGPGCNHDHDHDHDHDHGRPQGIRSARNIIAIASGKGGVGKSTVTVNLAVALQATGARVGILDADIYGPSQPGMLGAKTEEVRSQGDLILPTERFGIQFVSMGLLLGADREDTPVIWRAPMAVKILQQFISGVAWGDLDYLLIDLPPGTGDVQLTLAQQAALTGAVIVTTPQQVALGIAKKGLRMFQQVNVPILGIVENMSGYTCAGCGQVTDLFAGGGGEAMAKELHVPFLGRIPMDAKILKAGDDGVPVVSKDPDGGPSQAFLVLARELQMKLLQFAKTGNPEPEKVELTSSGQLFIQWSDGHHGLHRPWTLRTRCACAVCVDENTGRQLLDPGRVRADIRIEGYDPVGRYAIGIRFSDGHTTGIFSFSRLRLICECPDCVSALSKGTGGVSGAGTGSGGAPESSAPPTRTEIEDLLRLEINPKVAGHGGSIEVVAYSQDQARVEIRMAGGCQGCASAQQTLKLGVERSLRARFPGLREIVDVTDHGAGEKPYYT